MASSTKKAAEATELSVQEMKEMRDVETAPQVIAYFEISQERLIYLVVKNIGNDTATNVKLRFDPPLQTSDQQISFDDILLIKDGIPSMSPGYELRTILDSSVEYFGNTDLPLQYSAVVSFCRNGSDRVQILPHAQAGRLPAGLSAQESLRNR